jgi:energy-converting hydrogenase A subunit M
MMRRDQLIEILKEARSDLASYVDADYPENLRAQHALYDRRWRRDMELCWRIDAIISQETDA